MQHCSILNTSKIWKNTKLIGFDKLWKIHYFDLLMSFYKMFLINNLNDVQIKSKLLSIVQNNIALNLEFLQLNKEGLLDQ